MKGPSSEATKAIFAFIQEHQPVSHRALCDRFQPQAAACAMPVKTWLSKRMENMVDAGYLAHEAGGWVVLMEGAGSEPEAPLETSVAEPRRTNMFGPAYVPPAPVHRRGADDHARHPSLINGAPRPYRSAW